MTAEDKTTDVAKRWWHVPDLPRYWWVYAEAAVVSLGMGFIFAFRRDVWLAVASSSLAGACGMTAGILYVIYTRPLRRRR